MDSFEMSREVVNGVIRRVDDVWWEWALALLKEVWDW